MTAKAPDYQRQADALLAKYPYDPKIDPAVYQTGSPERLRGVPPGARESLAMIYVRSLKRWQRDAELDLRARHGKPGVLVDDPTQERYR